VIGVKFEDNESYPLCKDARFDNDTIIDDKKLSRHFRNNSSNPESVPPAVKDKRELREKLEKRGFDTKTIDRYLSLSSLADSETTPPPTHPTNAERPPGRKVKRYTSEGKPIYG
jgi:hypothetical protein